MSQVKPNQQASLEQQYQSLIEATSDLGERSPKQCYKCELWFNSGDEDIVSVKDEKSYQFICVNCSESDTSDC